MREWGLPLCSTTAQDSTQLPDMLFRIQTGARVHKSHYQQALTHIPPAACSVCASAASCIPLTQSPGHGGTAALGSLLLG
jgi:hypothetical protein